MRKGLVLIFLSFFVFLHSYSVKAQDQTMDGLNALGTYSPYSMFGLGEIEKQGSGYNLSMGGIGIGLRDNRFINITNPASITKRDTLAFMLDFGVHQKNNYSADANTKSVYNVFSMHNFVMTFPIWKKSAFMVGVHPYSSMGYKLESTENDDYLVSQLGDIKYQKYGSGSINQVFLGAAFDFLKYFSLGAQATYYFGYLNKSSDVVYNSSTSYNTIKTGWDYKVNTISAKFGLQYEQPFKESNSTLAMGVTYNLGNSMKGDVVRYAYTVSGSGVIDTIKHFTPENAKISIASELGVGVSYKKSDKWTVGFDYIRQDWTNGFYNTPGIDFSPQISQSFKGGMEYIPNRYDPRYYMKRITYRAGVYYDKSYISLNSHQISSLGITFGMSLPIYKWYNSISIAVDMGQRGLTKHQLIRERYINFIINVNLHDIWFIKYRYD